MYKRQDEYDKFIDGIQVVDGANARTSGVWETETLAQNLPYGTHIVKIKRQAADVYSEFYKEFTFHQPKMPPIPEDACIIADYMLMADYVKSTAGASEKVSKGVRLVSTTRDCHFDSTATYNTIGIDADTWVPFGMTVATASNPSAGVSKIKLPSFGTQMEIGCYGTRGDVFVDGVDTAHTATGSGYSGLLTQDTASTLGVHIFESRSTGNNHNTQRFGIASPIHTSSHYQTFETPFLRELVGGDRNMEQTNLVVTADGKTWDEVTRDVSYLGPECVFTTTDTATTWSSVVIMDEWRGQHVYSSSVNSRIHSMNKDFAIAYDRMICLRDGTYKWSVHARVTGSSDTILHINGTERQVGIESTGATIQILTASIDVNLKRGDFLEVKGEFAENGSDFYYNYTQITRLDK